MKMDRITPMLPVRSMPASVEFYEKLGFQVEKRNDDWRWALLRSGASWTDRGGTTHALTGADILVVAPYNDHRLLVEAALQGMGHPGVRVGTVDKFQGQEAPISIYTMASSSADDAPRGMEFLYSLNRLNVATSRARCLCLLVASPAVSKPSAGRRVRCSSRMRSAAFWNWLGSRADAIDPGAGRPSRRYPRIAARTCNLASNEALGTRSIRVSRGSLCEQFAEEDDRPDAKADHFDNMVSYS